MEPSSPSLDSRQFRQTMGRFATGVAIVSCQADGELHGMTVNSLTSVSLEPPLVLVCFNRSARTEAAVRAAGRFGISFLREEQGELSNRFARRGEDHFAGLELRYEGGVPLLPGTLGYLVCETVETYVQGDHSIVVAQVVRAAAEAGRPLLFFGGKYHALGGPAGSAEYWYW